MSYTANPALVQYLGSSICLLALTSYMMRPSVLKEAHPELDNKIPIQPELQK